MKKRRPKVKNGGYKASKFVCTNCKQKRLRKVRIGHSNTSRTKKLKAANLKKHGKTKDAHYYPKQEDRLEQYTVYSIVNYGFFSDKGNMFTSVARGFLRLYRRIERDKIKCQALDDWEEEGERMVVLKGYNHRHLCFLAQEVRRAATGTHSLYHSWSRSHLMLVLSVMGKVEDLEPFLGEMTELH